MDSYTASYGSRLNEHTLNKTRNTIYTTQEEEVRIRG